MACRDQYHRERIYNDQTKKKKCACCREWKPCDEYAENSGKKAGKRSLQAYCKPCSLRKSYEWAMRNPEARRRINKKARENSERRPLTEEQRQRKNARHREWRKRNIKKVLLWNTVRRNRQRAAGEMPDTNDLMAMLCLQDYQCNYCGKGLHDDKHLDHKKPVSRGGLNNWENLQWLCGPCNLKKGTRTHQEYAADVGVHQLPEPPIPDCFDAESFAAAMESGDYLEAQRLLAETIERVTA